MAATIARTILTKTSTIPATTPYLSTRLLSSSSSPISKPYSIPHFSHSRRSPSLLSHAVQLLNPATCTQLTTIRNRITRSGDSAYSPLNSSGSSFSDRPPSEIAPLFPGCDYNHWLIVMEKPGGDAANKDQMIDCYIKTLARVLGNEEEAKKKIYNVSCHNYFGFGCEIDEETSNKLEGLPGVLFVLPDSYVDAEYKDYGAELLVDGKIVQRTPERERRVQPPSPNTREWRPRYNDQTRHARRRENQQSR